MTTNFKIATNMIVSDTVDLDDVLMRREYLNVGTLWTWGNDFAGALGDNNTVNRSSPVTVAGTNVNWKTVVACNYSMHGIVDITF